MWREGLLVRYIYLQTTWQECWLNYQKKEFRYNDRNVKKMRLLQLRFQVYKNVKIWDCWQNTLSDRNVKRINHRRIRQSDIKFLGAGVKTTKRRKWKRKSDIRFFGAGVKITEREKKKINIWKKKIKKKKKKLKWHQFTGDKNIDNQGFRHTTGLWAPYCDNTSSFHDPVTCNLWLDGVRLQHCPCVRLAHVHLQGYEMPGTFNPLATIPSIQFASEGRCPMGSHRPNTACCHRGATSFLVCQRPREEKEKKKKKKGRKQRH